jgi:hypothetical protein
MMLRGLTRAEFRFADDDHGVVTVQCILRKGKLAEFAVILGDRTVRLGRFEVGSNVWPCESHARLAAKVALSPKERRTPADARRERENHGLREPRRLAGPRLLTVED